MPAPRPPTVCVVGSLNMDLLVRAPRLPSPGETLLGGAFRTLPGGKGANQAVAAARAGASVSMIGRVGDDAHGREMLAVLRAESADTTAVTACAGVPTGVALITVAEDGGENTIVVASGANAALTVDDVEAAAADLRTADVLLMQLESPLPALTRAARTAREAGVTVILNAAPAQALPASLLASIDLLIANRSEAALLTGLQENAPPARLLSALATLGPRTSVLTLGRDGAAANTNGRTLQVGAYRVTATDAVGAGDAFAGTLAASIAARTPLERSLLDAAAAGALATTKPGAIPSLPSAADTRALVASQPGVTVQELT